MLTQIVFLINLFFAIQHVLSLWLFSVIKYRPQKIVLPACPGDLPACPPKRTKVKGKCAGVPSIYILQPDIIRTTYIISMIYHVYSVFCQKLSKSRILSLQCKCLTTYKRECNMVIMLVTALDISWLNHLRAKYAMETYGSIALKS